MKRFVGLMGIAAAIVAAAIVAAAVFERMRRAGDLRRVVTQRFNPFVMRFGLAGGRLSPWGIVEHVGRTTGRTYLTPISLAGGDAGERVYIRLTYGTDVHWVANILAAGRCRLRIHATTLELADPIVVPATDNEYIPPRLRGILDRAGRRYLRLLVLARTPPRSGGYS
jgi:deazaflavin-dependent oxidoreductase (nitroreductase family)